MNTARLLATCVAMTACVEAEVRVEASAPGRPKDCAVRWVTSDVAATYDRLGEVTIGMSSSQVTPAGQLDIVRPYVCEMGGDVVAFEASSTRYDKWGFGYPKSAYAVFRIPRRSQPTPR